MCLFPVTRRSITPVWRECLRCATFRSETPVPSPIPIVPVPATPPPPPRPLRALFSLSPSLATVSGLHPCHPLPRPSVQAHQSPLMTWRTISRPAAHRIFKRYPILLTPRPHRPFSHSLHSLSLSPSPSTTHTLPCPEPDPPSLSPVPRVVSARASCGWPSHPSTQMSLA